MIAMSWALRVSQASAERAGLAFRAGAPGEGDGAGPSLSGAPLRLSVSCIGRAFSASAVASQWRAGLADNVKERVSAVDGAMGP